ncbi:MAG: DNA repair protein RecN, partial [Burkholderiaceae bacterium]
MLQRLRLREFVIVDEAEIVFGPGFSVLTGETGAGKSILLDALALLMGARADAGVVREGAARADLSAEFAIGEEIGHWLAERELAGDPGQLLLRRVIDADGRSRALINGHPGTATQLRELGDRLIDIHGQHAAQSMLRADGQRELIDAFGGLSATLREVGDAYQRWRELKTALERAESDDRELALERERVEWRLGELAPLKPVDGEWDELNAEQKRLSHAAALIEGTAGAAAALNDDEASLASRLYALIQKLQSLVNVDASLQGPVDLLQGAQIQIEEAASTLAGYARHVDLDPSRLAALDERIGALFSAARKLRVTPDALPAECQALQAQLARLNEAADLERLRKRVDAARHAYDDAAKRLSAGRREVAVRLADGVSHNIQQLGMRGGRLDVAFDDAPPSANGIDRIEFRVAGHAGATPRALAKVASGGELSRIGLAISVLAAQDTPVPTLIFDEADAGVGGGVAEVIGALMRRLGQTRQVLCVTHLPQVAAQAHQQFAVSKAQRADTTVSEVRPLDRAERVEEIARMLGGMAITDTTRRHAREMLAGASTTDTTDTTDTTVAADAAATAKPAAAPAVAPAAGGSPRP